MKMEMKKKMKKKMKEMMMMMMKMEEDEDEKMKERKEMEEKREEEGGRKCDIILPHILVHVLVLVLVLPTRSKEKMRHQNKRTPLILIKLQEYVEHSLFFEKSEKNIQSFIFFLKIASCKTCFCVCFQFE